MSKPHILVVDNSVATTGSIVSSIRACSALSGHYDFIFVVPARSTITRLVRDAGFAVEEIPYIEIGRSWKLLIYLPVLAINLFRFRRIIRRHRPSLIVVNDFYNLLAAVYRLTGGAVPYVTFVRFVPERFPALLVGAWCRLHYSLAERIIAVSHTVARNLSGPNVTTIHDQHPGDRFGPFPYDTESCIILYMANYIPGKGQQHAIRAMAQLAPDFPGWTIRFVGGDMGLEKNRRFRIMQQQLAAELGIESIVTFGGSVNDVVPEYRAAALVLNFSESESFSLTCLEAMAVGRPTVATRCGGPEEIITPGIDGELVERGNVPDMVAAMKKLMGDRQLRKLYGQRAAGSVRSKFNADNTTGLLEQLYREVLSSH
ncbi:MAG TPA: glycosyltransferase family 4 protein [Cyclobacteriaceae bacterium]|nr:glycosyltransferase family 4 protein [Cyclobacteriaceae bacterium]